AQSAWNETLAPYGGFSSSIDLSLCVAWRASQVGGSRSDKLSAVIGRSTLPALAAGGSPSAPITVRAGRQVLLRISSTGSLETARAPAIKGKLSAYRVRTLEAAAIWLRRAGGTVTLNADRKST